MLPYRDGKVTRVLLLIFFVLVVGYAYFEAQGLLFGPAISVTSEITEVHDPFVTVRGRADRISSLAMNGNPITVTENGDFNEPYLLAQGSNRIVLDATDKYGRSRRQVITIVYTPSSSTSSTDSTDAEQTAPTASTTPIAQ